MTLEDYSDDPRIFDPDGCLDPVSKELKIEALKLSIEHWKSTDYTTDKVGDDCACCHLAEFGNYFDKARIGKEVYGLCNTNCPIYDHTKAEDCCGPPYASWRAAKMDSRADNTKRHYKEMILLMKTLLENLEKDA